MTPKSAQPPNIRGGLMLELLRLAESARRMGFVGSFDAECERIIGRRDLTPMERVQAARVLVWSIGIDRENDKTGVFEAWPSMPAP